MSPPTDMAPRFRAVSILGGRPHLAKCEPIHSAFAASKATHETVECWIPTYSDYPATGHGEFALPEPSRTVTLAEANEVADAIDGALAELQPDVVIIYGDLETTLYALVASTSRRIATVHVEGGYRGGSLLDPEERTRILVDHGTTHRVAFSEPMVNNLVAESIPRSTISVYGNPTLQVLQARLSAVPRSEDQTAHTPAGGLVTFHHHENLSDRDRLAELICTLGEVSVRHPLTIILYQRTKLRLTALNLMLALERLPNIRVLKTLRYPEYLAELLSAEFVITDSSGLQDECAFLRKPCFIVRTATPRRELLGPLMQPVGDLVGSDLSMRIHQALSGSRSQSNSDSTVLARLTPRYDAGFVNRLHSVLVDGFAPTP